MSEKKSRTTAKRKFTLERKGLQRAIDSNESIDIVTNSFRKLNDLWSEVQNTHEAYLRFLDVESEAEDEDTWIEELQDKFRQVEREYYAFIKKENVLHEVSQEKDQAVEQENLLKELSIKEMQFNNKVTLLMKMIESSEIVEGESILHDTLNDMKHSCSKLEEVHERYIMSLDQRAAESNMNWILKAQEQYRMCCLKYNAHLKAISNKSVAFKQSTFKLEKMKLPSFSGDLKEYTQFKSDFLKYVLPEIDKEKSAFILKSCLGTDPLNSVKNIEDSIDSIWNRLDEKYGQPSMLTELVMNEIKRYKSLTDTDDKGLVDFIDIVESSHNHLKLVNMEQEISNLSVVSLIEEKLPNMIRRKWAEEISKEDSKVDKRNPFPYILKFLSQQRRTIEYVSADLRAKSSLKFNKDMSKLVKSNPEVSKSSCWIHKSSTHNTATCTVYLGKSNTEKVNTIKEYGACWNCLQIGHRVSECIEKAVCSIEGCKKRHHQTLHEAHVEGIIYQTSVDLANAGAKGTVFQIMSIPCAKGSRNVNVLWDGGSNCSLITFSKAQSLALKGKPIRLTIQKVGESLDERQSINSFMYNLSLRDIDGAERMFQVYGVQKISSNQIPADHQNLNSFFPQADFSNEIKPVGDIDVLIGIEYAALHPQIIEINDQLVLSENCFGKCVSGSHTKLTQNSQQLIENVTVNHIIGESIDEFINSESLGNSYNMVDRQRHDISIKEKREMDLIESGLTFKGNYWEAQYPWVKSSYYLPNNHQHACAILKSTEKRLMKDKECMHLYRKQIQDMLDRKVARKLCTKEMKTYDGPVYYISHHEVLKPDSESTPYRIVFNSSSVYKGHILNDYWAKGPTLINNLAGVLLRFRENLVAVVGDVQKMYHSIKIAIPDQHTHRFLWRDFDVSREPDTYVMTSICFGDRPAGAIAITALNKTADMAGQEFQRAKDTIKYNSYVDDLIDSFSSYEEGKLVTSQIDDILLMGGFKIKEWVHSEESKNKVLDFHSQGNTTNSCDDIESLSNTDPSAKRNSQKVLGIHWEPGTDVFRFTVKLNFSKKTRGVKIGPDLKLEDIQSGMLMPLTKRLILSCINGLYDPMGLLAPFIICAKMLLRKLWLADSGSLGWDDSIPIEMQKEWQKLFVNMFEVDDIHFKRCIKPDNAVDEDPILLVFCDSSESAFGACAYVRWRLNNNKFAANLMMAKTHVAPVKTVSIVKLEVNGARLGSRLKTFITTESRLRFSKIYMIVDSEIALAMIQKDSYKLNTYFGVRISEIQQRTNTCDWYWTNSTNNIADWLSRGKTPIELQVESEWQKGPMFLQQDESEWPFKQTHNILEIPEAIKTVMNFEIHGDDSLSSRIAIDRFSSYMMLIRVTCRILACYHRRPHLSFRNILDQPTSEDYRCAIEFWIRDAQSSISNFEKVYANLGPIKCEESGIYMVGRRVEKWMEYSYNDIGLPLLPYDHKLSFLYAVFTHEIGHHGVMTTVSKLRLRFWITKANRLVQRIVRGCVTCRKNSKDLEQQKMGQLPIERLQPSPPFYNVAVDYFGPFMIKGEVNQRSKGKGYGVIFTCLYTRAVFVELANSASTDSFLIVLRKFVSIRGYPAKLFTDNGTQFKSASKELKGMLRNIDWKKVCEFGAENGVEWHFSPADAPWQNGCVESLIKPVKKAIKLAVGQHVLKFSELQVVLYEAANLVNERPVGKHPTSPEEGSYLCPNDILLGRATARVPGGPFKEVSGRRRFEFVQCIADLFWKKWTRNYFPSLIVHKKWHTEKRNLQVDDIVIVKDTNAVRGNWRIGRVSKTYTSEDGCVRRCQIAYKQARPGLSIPKTFSTIERPVQDVVVILPAGSN